MWHLPCNRLDLIYILYPDSIWIETIRKKSIAFHTKKKKDFDPNNYARLTTKILAESDNISFEIPDAWKSLFSLIISE